MHIIIFNKEVLKADVLCYGFTAKDFEAERKGKKNTNHKCNQQSRGKKVFGYASRPPIMGEHRFYWGLRYHLANVGVFFFFCFVLSVDTHISFSHPPLTGSQLCPCQYSVSKAFLFNQSSDYPFQHFQDENDAVDYTGIDDCGRISQCWRGPCNYVFITKT